MAVSVTLVMVMRWSEELLCLVPGQVSEDAILDVASEEAFLRERHGVLVRIVSPAHHPGEE